MQEDSKASEHVGKAILLLVAFGGIWLIVKAYPKFFLALLSIGLAAVGIAWCKKLDTTEGKSFVAVFVSGLIAALCWFCSICPWVLPLSVLFAVITGMLWLRNYAEEQRCREEEQRRCEEQEEKERLRRRWKERLIGKFREIEQWSVNSSVVLDSNVWMNEGNVEPESIAFGEVPSEGAFGEDFLSYLAERDLLLKFRNVSEWEDRVRKHPFLMLIEVLSSPWCPNARIYVPGWQLDELANIKRQAKFADKRRILAIQAQKRIEALQTRKPSRIVVEDVHAWPNTKAYLDAFLVNKVKRIGGLDVPLTVVTNDRDLRIRLRGAAGDHENISVIDRNDLIGLLSLKLKEDDET